MEPASFPLIAFSAYALGTASPGPANMSIMATSIEAGRKAGLVMALGVIVGSLSWGLMAATGLGALLHAYPGTLQLIRMGGGLFFLWLAYRALRIVFAPAVNGSGSAASPAREMTMRRHFLRGLAIHLTNPKAVLVWTTTITLGMSQNAPPALAYFIVGGCAVLGILVFSSYALVFSSQAMVRGYLKARKLINALIAGFYALFGAELLLQVLS